MTFDHADNDCLIAFGSNEGDSPLNFQQAVQCLRESESFHEVLASQPLVTKPVGGPARQNDYLNACIRLRAACSALDLFRRLMEIEIQLGRRRRGRWASRKIDLDLLLFGTEPIANFHANLEIPHPRMTFRQFVLKPASAIAADMVHPITNMKIGELLQHIQRPENRIRLVTNRPDNWVDRLQTICFDYGWEFCLCSTEDLGRETSKFAKLNVYLDNEANLVESMIAGFGPLLKLQPCAKNIDRELTAALDAMTTC